MSEENRCLQCHDKLLPGYAYCTSCSRTGQPEKMEVPYDFVPQKIKEWSPRPIHTKVLGEFPPPFEGQVFSQEDIERAIIIDGTHVPHDFQEVSPGIFVKRKPQSDEKNPAFASAKLPFFCDDAKRIARKIPKELHPKFGDNQ